MLKIRLGGSEAKSDGSTGGQGSQWVGAKKQVRLVRASAAMVDPRLHHGGHRRNRNARVQYQRAPIGGDRREEFLESGEVVDRDAIPCDELVRLMVRRIEAHTHGTIEAEVEAVGPSFHVLPDSFLGGWEIGMLVPG